MIALPDYIDIEIFNEARDILQADTEHLKSLQK